MHIISFFLKKFFKIFVKTLLALLLLVLVLWILLQTSFFQNFLIKKVTAKLSKNLHTTVSIRHIDLELFDRMAMEGLLVLDKKNDTLLYAGSAKVTITDWFFFKDQVTLRYIGLSDALVNLNRKDSVWNYQFLADYFSGPRKQTPDTSKDQINLDIKVINLKNIRVWQKDAWRGEDILAEAGRLNIHADIFDTQKRVIRLDEVTIEQPSFTQYDYTGNRPPVIRTTQSSLPLPAGSLQWNPDGWQLSINKFTLKDGLIAIEKESTHHPLPGVFDDSHIILSGLNADFKNFRFTGDTLRSHILISAKDRGGFEIRKLDADFTFTPVLMEFRNLDLETPASRLRDYYAMHYQDFNKDMGNFVHAVTLDGHFNNSEVSSNDLAYFAPAISHWNTLFHLSGKAHGKVDNISATDMLITAGKDNYAEGTITLKGLPDIEHTFIDFRSTLVKTSYSELSRVVPDLKDISPDLSPVGNVSFSGSYTGYLNDFVAYGTLRTDLGTLTTDLHMKFPSGASPSYKGKVSTPGFHLGKLIGNSQIGNVAFDGTLNGRGFQVSTMELDVDGNIRTLEFNRYPYSNIVAHGDFRNKVFTGTVRIDDPHIKIDTLTGSVNFAKPIPEYDLNAYVDRLHLRSLGFTKDSVSLKGNFVLNFSGSDIDNFLGSARLYNATLKDNGRQLSFDSLAVTSTVTDGKRLLTLATNELNAALQGDFRILELPDAFQLFLNRYYPAYIEAPRKKLAGQDFSFFINTRDISQYVSLFVPRLGGFQNSSISGNINIADNVLNLQADIPRFQYSNISFDEVHLTGKGTSDSLYLKGEISDVVINDSLHSPLTRISVTAANDVSDISIMTNGTKTLSDASLSARLQTRKNGFRLIFNPSTFTINQKQWHLEKEGELDLDNEELTANNLKFSQNGQELFISTQPSDITGKNDILVAAQHIVVEDIAPMFFKSPSLSGYLNGNIRISDPFGARGISFDTRFDEFRFQNDSIGVITANGEYDDSTGLTVNALSNNDLYNFSGSVSYNPHDTTLHQLNGSVVLNNSEIHVLENYLNTIFHDIKGRATGTLNITGRSSAPKLVGSVRLDSTSMVVNYTQCRYILNDHSLVTFNPDEIDLGIIKLKDTLNHTATLTGKIYHSFFDNFFFNELHLKTDAIGNRPPQFLLLNTTAGDNKEFYGKVIGQAELSLNGFVNDMRMSISGEPTDSSHIYLPTDESAETGSLDYIEFIKFGREMKADLSSRENTNIKVDMELTANPLAKIDVILDETTGDVIKAQGSGKLNISAGTRDPLVIRGRYDISQGEYTFNFQTFLKMPFILQQGFIEWSGDPYLARLDIDALYRAVNVDLSNIPTSTGATNNKGDVDIIFKLRGTLKNPSPQFEFQFPFDNPLKSDPIANEYLKTRYQGDQKELTNTVTSLLLFNSFISSDQSLLSGNNTGNFVTGTVGQLLSAKLSSSLNEWLQKLLNSHSVNLYTNINTSDFNFQKGANQRELQNIGNFGVKTNFLNNKFLLKVGGNVDYRAGQAVTNANNANFLFTPDVSFEYLITPDGRLRVIGFNRSDADLGDIAGVTRRNRTGVQLSYTKDFDSFTDFFINERKRRRKGK